MVNKNARNTDPSTSKLAAADVDDQLAADRAKVYATFKEQHPRPLADFELEELLGGARNGKWRKRRSDLKEDDVVVAVDRIINPATRKQVIRWGLRSEATASVQAAPSAPQPPSLLTLMGVSEAEWQKIVEAEKGT